MTDPYRDFENPTHALNQMAVEYWPAVAMPDNCIIETARDLVPDQVAKHFRHADQEFSRRIANAQVFDFGLCDVVQDGSRMPYILDLFTGGFIDLPYPTVLYQCGQPRCRLTLAIDRLTVVVPNVARSYRTVIYVQDGSERTFGLLGTAIYGFQQRDEATVNLDFMPSRELFDGRLKFQAAYAPEGTHVNQQVAEVAVRWFLNCALALATDGVPRETFKASSLINAERARKGKPRVPTVTRVNFAAYLAAIEQTDKGHHASPVPHLRRGHIRRLEDGRRVWVRDCLVNASPDVRTVRRDKYVVNPPEVPDAAQESGT